LRGEDDCQFPIGQLPIEIWKLHVSIGNWKLTIEKLRPLIFTENLRTEELKAESCSPREPYWLSLIANCRSGCVI
jgi:hypothetical protein